MQALSMYLTQNLQIEKVWLDYGCVPQGKRTAEEQALFNRTLPIINLLYLGTKVLRIVGKSYFVRFWPQFECYLSKQMIHKYGFKAEHNDRCNTVFVEDSPAAYSSDMSFYDKCTYEEAV